MRVWYFSAGVFCAAVMCGQTIVEHSAATAGASTAAAGAKGAGKSLGDVFRGLSDTLDKAGSTKENGSTPATTTVTTHSNQSKPTTKPVLASKPIDPSQVTEGLDRDELIKRFGEPVLQLSEKHNSQLIERLWYNTTASDQLEIELVGGKVASVRPPPSKKPEESRTTDGGPSSPAEQSSQAQ
jgi:hypothetical protein